MDYIYVMRDGSISEAGTFDDLVDKNGDFAEFLRTYVTEQEPESHEHADGMIPTPWWRHAMEVPDSKVRGAKMGPI